MAELTDEQKVMRNATGQYIGDQIKFLRYLMAGGLPDGGTDGQLLRKKGDADYELEWYTPNYAPLDSPAFTGTPKAPTAASGTNSTQLATTAFVQQEKHLGITGASVGDLIRVGAVDANGKPTSWEHVPLYPSNENLLDNWYFVGGGSQLGDGVFPINQRGQTIFTNLGDVMFDRWFLTGSSSTKVSLINGGVDISKTEAGDATIAQRLPDGLANQLAGKEVTISVRYSGLSGGSLIVLLMNANGSSSYNIRGETTGTEGILSATGTIPSDLSNGMSLRVAKRGAGEIVIQAVKFELGSYQSLAHQDASGNWVLNELPDFGEEMAKCQRFLYAIDGGGSATDIGFAYAPTASYATLIIQYPKVLVKSPTLTIQNGGFDITKGAASAALNVTSASILNATKERAAIGIYASGVESGAVYRALLKANSKIILSAE